MPKFPKILLTLAVVSLFFAPLTPWAALTSLAFIFAALLHLMWRT